MLTNTCPVEIWLHVFSYLDRDLVILLHCCKHLYDIAEDVRKHRQDLHRLLATFVKDVDRFQLLMMHTGAGNIATSFFAEEVPGNVPRYTSMWSCPIRTRYLMKVGFPC